MVNRVLNQKRCLVKWEGAYALIKRVSIVLAKYCPHCLPFSLSNATRMAEDLKVPLRVLDIEIPDQLKEADRLVEEHGDWSEDYLIPQVFVEYTDGRIEHVLTGFSEAVAATEASWDALFSSSYYQTLMKLATTPKPLREFVKKHLTFKGRCRHCDGTSSFVDLQSDANNVIGAYACPDGCISRVVYFGVNPNIELLKNFLASQVGEEIVTDRDIRPATRHGWELGSAAMAEIRETSPTGVIKETYWTRYPRTEEEKNRGIFICSSLESGKGCGRLFVQDINSKNRLCQKCTQSQGDSKTR